MALRWPWKRKPAQPTEMDVFVELLVFVRRRWREAVESGQSLASAQREYGRLMGEMTVGALEPLDVVKGLAQLYANHPDHPERRER